MHYFEFHFQKIIAATKGWKDDEFGAYVRLLIEQFDRGYIADDPAEIGRLVTSYKKNWPLLKKKFTEPSQPGQLRNTFMVKIRDEAVDKSIKNSESGSKGGRAKKANAIANGTALGKQTVQRSFSERGSQPVTSNQEPVSNNTTPEEGDGVNDAPDEPLEANHYRKPKIPTFEKVLECFVRNGGNAVMAKKFFDSNAATSWYYRGSPITNFANLVPGYIENWTRNDGTGKTDSDKPKKMTV